ncbi:MAG: SCO family protein [Rhizobiaceae bacterium]|nr:SCO family protein [Rhizobiaceae bacterium]
MRRFRTLLAALSIGAACACAAPSLAHERTPHGTLMQEGEIEFRVDPEYKPPDPESLGGSWDLVDHNGRLVTDKDFRGKWMLVFFGFAGCREACPGALMTMGEAIDQLGPDGDAIQPLFVDFSMEEPDYLGLAQFVSNFHPRLIGLTGDRKQTFQAVRKFKVRREYAMTNFSSKETGPRINHTTYIYVIDPDGRTRGYFYDALPIEGYVDEIRYHLARYEAEHE